MLIVCWSAKGGSGTTVVSCSLALLAARLQPTLLIDLAGDVPAALGLAEPGSPGVHDWILTPTANSRAAGGLTISVNDNLQVLPRGQRTASSDDERWGALADLDNTNVIVDAGTGAPPPALFARADQRFLVTQPCYLSLRRHAASGLTPTGVVLMCQPGRALRHDDVVHAIKAPIVAEVAFDPAVARAVDAGLLAARIPRHLAGSLRGLIPASAMAA